jgi:hypothetical protein
MIIEVFKCDVCGKIKGEANAWLMGKIAHYASDSSFYALGDWSEEAENNYTMEHICSEACAMKRQAEFIRRPRVEKSI